jgi:hypothetical protein
MHKSNLKTPLGEGLRHWFEILIISVVLTCPCVSTLAATRYVPSQYLTIQAAINNCNNGDTVIVSPGTYYENINLNGKNITLRSTDPVNSNTVKNTTIDSTVSFRGTEDPNCTLTGFNINGTIIG